jgi:hypothetical protein
MGWSAGQLGDGVRRHLLLAALGAGFFAYAAARAWLVPITWDEAYSYLEFTRTGALSPFEFPPLAANNHFLNTWLTWVTARVFGPSELSLRLPALGGHLLFLYYSARLCARWEPLLLGCAAFVVLNANPYVLDFFALSRGYGIAYGLMAGSIWHLNRYLEAGLRIRSAVASVAFALLAVAAHLTLLHFALAVLAVVVAAPALLGGERLPLGARLVAALRRTAVPIALAMAFLVPTALVVRGLRRVEAFYYGGEASFWHDTIVTVFDSSLYERDYLAAVGGPPGALSHLLGVLAVFTLVIAGWQSIQLVSRRPWGAAPLLPALVVVLLTCWLASVAQHVALDVPYLTRRTALYLLVLFAFVFVVVVAELGRQSVRWRALLGVAALATGAHLLNAANVTYALEWKTSADVRQMVQDLAALSERPEPGKVNTTVGAHIEFEAPLNYYRATGHVGWLNLASRATKDHPLNDFYLYTAADWERVVPDSFVVLKSYALTGNRLARRARSPVRYRIGFDRTLDFEGDADPVFVRGRTTATGPYRGARSGTASEISQRSGGITAPLDSAALPAGRSLVAVTAMVWLSKIADGRPLLVVQFTRGGRAYASYHLPVRDAAVRARDWYPIAFTCFTPPDARQGDTVSAFVWSEKIPVRVDDLRMQWAAPEY